LYGNWLAFEHPRDVAKLLLDEELRRGVDSVEPLQHRIDVAVVEVRVDAPMSAGFEPDAVDASFGPMSRRHSYRERRWVAVPPASLESEEPAVRELYRRRRRRSVR